MEKIFSASLKDSDGFVLPYILLVTILVIALLLSLLSIVFMNNKLLYKRVNKKKTELACFSALQVYLSGNNYTQSSPSYITIDSVAVKVEDSNYGLYRSILTKAVYGGDSSCVEYFVGYSPDTLFENAIIISRPQLLLTAAGETDISGNICADADKITHGNIFGIKPAKVDFLDGKIKPAKNLQVKLFPDSLMKALINSQTDITGKKNIGKSLTLNENTVGDIFRNDTLTISGNLYIEGNFSLNHKKTRTVFYVAGKTEIERNSSSYYDIEIHCDSSITFKGNNHFENCMLTSAGNININGGCEFRNVQFYSKRNINISNCSFLYPSTAGIFINASDKSDFNNVININSSIYNGTVLLISSTAGLPENKSKIYIDDKSIFQGAVYSENNVELKGMVRGFVYTYNFIYYENPTEYINWLINLKIDRPKLDKWFLLPSGFTRKNNAEILSERWYY